MIVTILGVLFVLIGAILGLLVLGTAGMAGEPNAPSLGWPLGIGAVLVVLGGYLIFFT